VYTVLSILAWLVLGLGYGLIIMMGLGGVANWRRSRRK
jgi:hypothetical protein